MARTADDIFGPDPTFTQPTSSAEPEHLGRPEPMARTMPHKATGTDSPALALVVLVALAVVTLHLISR